MTTSESLTQQLNDTLPVELNVQIPSVDTDLFSEGIIDSLGLINLLFLIESKWGVKATLEQMEFDNFRTVRCIAKFIGTEQEKTR